MTSTYCPQPYKVSTITATGSIGSSIDLESFFISSHIESGKHFGIIYMEFGTKKCHVTESKGARVKPVTRSRKKKESKRFDNQVTILCRNTDEKVVNMKLFKNGNVQMTGIKTTEQGLAAIDTLIEHIKKTNSTIEGLHNNNFKIHLINSDFRTGILINRNNMNKLLQETYNIYSSFEPTIYPGVKVQYFWQESKADKCGTCNCTLPCTGKGNGKGDGDCKKITIAVFQSGCIIITGGRQTVQIDDAYKFICRLMENNLDYLVKVNYQLVPFIPAS